MNQTVTRIVSLGLAGLLLVATAAPALAASDPARDPGGDAQLRHGRCADEWRAFATDPTIAEGKALGACEIDRRIEDLGKVHDRVIASKVMTDSHQATSLRIIDRTTAGLRDLRAEIQGDTTMASLMEDLRRIAPEFRVYLVVIPQIHLTNAADAVGVIGGHFDRFAERASGYIELAKAAGHDTSVAEAALASMNAHVAAAEALVDGLAATVLELTPADWNDGSAKPILEKAREDLRAARDELRAARSDAMAVIEALRALRD